MGELGALENLFESDKKLICPILQIIPPKPSKKGDRNVDWNRLCNRINKLANINNIAIDPNFLGTENDRLNYVVDEISEDIEVIFVIRPNSSDDYLQYIKNKGVQTVILRIQTEYATPMLVNSTVQHVKEKLDVSEDSIMLLVDYGYISNPHINPIVSSFESILDGLKRPDRFKELIVSGGSFPIDVSDFQVDTLSSIPRIEWDLFQQLKSKHDSLKYSDYGIVHPIYNPSSANFQGSCTLKYSDKSQFLIFRGSKSEYHPMGHGQYFQKSRDLLASGYYMGSDFSFGDRYIELCANEQEGPGNAGSWVKVSQNHHFSLLTKLLN